MKSLGLCLQEYIKKEKREKEAGLVSPKITLHGEDRKSAFKMPLYIHSKVAFHLTFTQHVLQLLNNDNKTICLSTYHHLSLERVPGSESLPVWEGFLGRC